MSGKDIGGILLLVSVFLFLWGWTPDAPQLVQAWHDVFANFMSTAWHAVLDLLASAFRLLADWAATW